MAAGYDAIDLQIHREQADVRERLVRGERTREGAGAEDYV